MISSISRADGLTGNLKFSPNLQHKAQGYHIKSRSLQSLTVWTVVHEKVLLDTEVLAREEVVNICLPLLEEEGVCEFVVTIKYEAGEVDSPPFQEIFAATGKKA